MPSSRPQRWGSLMLLVVLLVASAVVPAAAAVSTDELEGFGDDWDDWEEEDEVAPKTVNPARAQVLRDELKDTLPAVEDWQDETDVAEDEPDIDELGAPGETAQPSKATPPRKSLSDYRWEILGLAFVSIYVANFLYNSRANQQIANAWAQQYIGSPDALFPRNFSLVGYYATLNEVDKGEGVNTPKKALCKDSHSLWKLYASGRRYCDGMLAELQLRDRQDLFALLYYLVFPTDDRLTIEVYMAEDAMPPIVFAVAKRKQGKVMHRNLGDLQTYTTPSEVPIERKKNWPEALAVYSESRELHTELITDVLMEQVFSEKAFEKCGQYFQSLHITDQDSMSLHKRVLRFVFSVPPKAQMADMTKLLNIVPYLVDTVGRCKLSAQAKAKAEAVRNKVKEEKAKEDNAERLRKQKEEREKDAKPKKQKAPKMKMMKVR
eukprot:jgi/Chlat1/4017/Chrsp26S04085